MGCPTQFNTTKFTRVGAFPTKFCIESDNDYELDGNFKSPGEAKTVVVNIDRC